MDPFDDLLRGVRADGAVFGRSVLAPPWALRFTDGASMTLCVPLRGEGWIVREDDGSGSGFGESGRPPRGIRIRVGEAAVVRGPEPFVFTDAPGTVASGAATPRDVRCGDVWPGERAGRDVAGELAGHAAGRTVLMAGAYHVRGEVPGRLLRVLPPVLVLADDHDCAALRDYLETQLIASGPCAPGGPGGAGAPGRAGGPGQQIVLDRLLDWLLVCTLRDWFARPEAEAPGWYRALGDEVVGPALRALHEAPGAPWTLASLADRAGVSRTTLAKRFHDLVGEPPLAYLTQWRMALAADLLAEPAATVASVARRVGYADAFGFSAAFKRVRGVSPSAHRTRPAALSPATPDRPTTAPTDDRPTTVPTGHVVRSGTRPPHPRPLPGRPHGPAR
ncbi:AraC family transcriptional regulator [Streptomyces sp. XD-27]|uniref:AraC family transcriptional regulator n=1 Tax=Streptomyces sp. XD-27 TaxID=3062779 RepID=UPI0026F420B4|nr:AraC family transcriptional regulator [Streptomyces sp. XD-27]WKX71107.1 AraC family transcriptional regulator [Streptomyces sp. XD-27]